MHGKCRKFVSHDYVDLLNEIDSIVRKKKFSNSVQPHNIDIKKNLESFNLIRLGGVNTYYVDNIVRRAPSLNKVDSNKNILG